MKTLIVLAVAALVMWAFNLGTMYNALEQLEPAVYAAPVNSTVLEMATPTSGTLQETYNPQQTIGVQDE